MMKLLIDQWSLTLNVTNLFDKNYVSICCEMCWYGAPRSVMLTANYDR
ncbi:TonB-dependent receptor [Salmonella enterica]|uniref:TonB-dependent receptor n=1 Tax=Salmonella diarizonae TaxID=59204 RepID=A0A702DDP0_SALDZ|nr:TonB-dependent receptor [Salmonella enterica]ECC3214324.1 TonB-dependent receptor [Salmonella enterica subsp. diarizonae]EHG3720516.1 TonB-dependent receptor [Salmonella enterica subsp. diarizonae serovar 11:k:z53]EKR1692418.1 TonB-dependent receptor [Salmonella enterica subsp. diarizonae serovar 6,7,14:k:z50]EAA9598985.1 TonB-dependent receptor [Salmonella enterica]